MVETFYVYYIYIYMLRCQCMNQLKSAMAALCCALGGVWSSIATLSSSGHGARAWRSQLIGAKIFGISQTLDL